MAMAAVGKRRWRVARATTSTAEAAVEGIEIIAVSALPQAVAFLTGEIEIEPTPSRLEDLFRRARLMTSISPTFEVRKWRNGRPAVRRSGESRPAGVRPPGSGKAHARQADADDPPRPAAPQWMETTRSSSIGRLQPGQRCWRSGRSARRITPWPDAGLVGGG
jgi:magnesium chelatase family protein